MIVSYRDYKPEYDKKHAERQAAEEKEREENLSKLREDLASGEGDEVSMSGDVDYTVFAEATALCQLLVRCKCGKPSSIIRGTCRNT